VCVCVCVCARVKIAIMLQLLFERERNTSIEGGQWKLLNPGPFWALLPEFPRSIETFPRHGALCLHPSLFSCSDGSSTA
jgi:hypothetical protein